MNTTEALIRLRDDLKEWVTNNLAVIGKPKASDVNIDPIDGMSATNTQGALEEINSKMLSTTFVGTLNRASDFDNLKDGCYYINTWGGSGGKNYPTAQGTGFLFQFSAGTQITQFAFYTNGKMPARICTSGTWDAWSA